MDAKKVGGHVCQVSVRVSARVRHVCQVSVRVSASVKVRVRLQR